MIIKDEYIGTPMKMFENGSTIVDNEPNEYTEFITINKLKDDSKKAKDENVETYASFVFEIDNEDLELQNERAKKLFEKKIVNRVVFSGGKSIHCRITLKKSPENKEEYKYIWKKLNELYFDNKADSACSNPARLTRMPNAIRKNGIKQKRLSLSNKLLDYDWKKDLEMEKKIDEYLLKQNCEKFNYVNKKTSIETLLKRNIPIEARKLLENSFIDGERHRDIPKAIGFLKYCGFELTEIESLVRATQINDGKNYVKNIYDYMK